MIKNLIFILSLFLSWFENAVSGSLAEGNGKSVCQTTLRAAIHGVFYDESGHILSAQQVRTNSLIVDTNLLVSYERVKRGKADLAEKAWFNYLNRQKKKAGKHGEEFRLWIAQRTAKEYTIKIRNSPIPTGTRLVPITVSRGSKEYEAVFEEVTRMKVGNMKGDPTKDREIITDIFFAQKRSESTIPTFATADKGIIWPLCKENPACAPLMNSENSGALIRNSFPNGFDVTIKSRTIRIVPI